MLVQEVGTLAYDSGMNFLQLDHRFPSPVGTLLTTRYFTLCSAQFCLSILIDSGILNFCAVRERCERSHPDIYPNCQITGGHRRAGLKD